MHHRKKYTIILALLISFLDFSAQEDTLLPGSEDTLVVNEPGLIVTEKPSLLSGLNGPMSDQSVETISYRLYLDKDWSRLSAYCDRAIKNNFDYYYLRVRAGVASFEKQEYRRAIVHFEKALQFNSDDDFAYSYLYYSYQYCERFEDAKYLTRSFSKALTNNMEVAAMSPVNFIIVENGIKSPDSSRQFKNALFSDVSVNHSIKNRIFVTHGLTYFAQNESRFSVKQFQYYLRGDLPLKNDYQLSAGLHFVNVSSDVRKYTGSTFTHTYLITPNGPPNMPPPQPQVISVTDSVYTERVNTQRNQNYVGAVTLLKHTLFADYSLGATFAGFDTTQQYQVGLGLNIYPFKNNNLAIGATAYLHSEAPFKNNFIAVAPVVSAYLSPKVHLFATYLNNIGPNISENTASFVSNSIDYTTQRVSLTASFNIARNLWAFGTYGYEQKKHLSAAYIYDYNIFVLGIKIFPQLK